MMIPNSTIMEVNSTSVLMMTNATTPWCIERTTSVATPGGQTLATTATPGMLLLTTMNVIPNVTLPFCDDDSPDGQRKSITDFWEYVAATYINKYYLYVIVALGLPGNLAALATVVAMKPFVSSSLYMAALSIFDSVNLILKLMYLLLTFNDVQLHDIGCKLSFFLGTFFMHLSNWILVAMTIERFVAIWFPLKVTEICTKNKAIVTITVIAVILLGLNLHFLFTMYEVKDKRLLYDCRFKDEYVYFREKIWYWIDGAAYSLLPFLALTVFNVLIVIGINRSAKTQKTLTNKQTKEKMSQQHQITVMLVTVSVVFVLLTMPNCVFFIVQDDWDYQSSLHETARYFLVFQVVFLLSDLNHAINFYLYFLSGKKFRRHFKALICCMKKQRPLRTQSTMITRSVRNTNYSISSSANSLVMNPSPTGERVSNLGQNGYHNGGTSNGVMKHDSTQDTSLNGSTLSLGDITVSTNGKDVSKISNGYVC